MSEFEVLRLVEIFGDAARLLFLCSLQAILLLGSIWILVKLFRNYSAAIRHNLWLAGLLTVAVLPLWAIVLRFFPASKPSVEMLPRFGEMPAIFRLLANEKSNGIFTTADIGWFDWVAAAAFAVWLVGVFICLIRFAVSYQRMKRICRNAQAIDGHEDFYQSLQIPARVKLYRSTEISNPVLVGVLRPAIVLPAEIEEWNAEEKRAIVRHELAHYERRDYLVRPLQTLLASIFFFHLLVRYALNQLSFERESACDERVLDSGIAPENYKEVILKVAEQDVLQRESYTLAFNPAKKILTRRISQIMNNQKKSMSNIRRYFLMANALLLLAFVIWFATPNGIAQVERGSSTSAQTADEETFKKLYEEMKQMILSGDKAAFEKFFAEDYTAVSPHGTILTRQQVVDPHVQHHQKATADMHLESVNFSELKVRVSGDTAIVTYLAEMSGNKHSHRARITDVWEKKEGKWLSVASHASAVH